MDMVTDVIILEKNLLVSLSKQRYHDVER